MPTISKRSHAAGLLAAGLLMLGLPLLTGCGKDSNPVAPHASAAEPESLSVTVTLQRVDAIADGDGIEGAGDFSFQMSVTEVGGGGRLFLSRSAGIDEGDSYTVNEVARFRIPRDRVVQIGFASTEWDRDILGRTYADSRMDNLSTSRSHSDRSTTAGVRSYTGYLRLGSGELEVRLHYTLKAVEI